MLVRGIAATRCMFPGAVRCTVPPPALSLWIRLRAEIPSPSACWPHRLEADLCTAASYVEFPSLVMREPWARHSGESRRENAGPPDVTETVLTAIPPSSGRVRPHGSRSRFALACAAAVFALGLVAGTPAETWRGLTVAPEHRCLPYDKKRYYPYPQSAERDIVRGMGAVYGPIRVGASHPPVRRTSDTSWLRARLTIPACARRTRPRRCGSHATFGT